MRTPHPIPYQGSKRHIARYILPFFPPGIGLLVEPFAGSAAVSIAAACYRKACRFHLNDVNAPLMALWREIIDHPQAIARSYEQLWTAQQGNDRQYYDLVREQFNRTQRPEHLLYLLARCVKASVRYNPKGEFNQSPDNRRLGRQPRRMADDILAVSSLFHGKATITSVDYREALERAAEVDLVYMDPPYQGVCGGGDPRYYSAIGFEEFMGALDRLNRRRISFILSYDGRTGDKSFGQELPCELDLCKIEIEAGRSSQSTLLGGDAMTYESIYLSPALVARLDMRPQEAAGKVARREPVQLELVSI